MATVGVHEWRRAKRWNFKKKGKKGVKWLGHYARGHKRGGVSLTKAVVDGKGTGEGKAWGGGHYLRRCFSKEGKRKCGHDQGKKTAVRVGGPRLGGVPRGRLKATVPEKTALSG